MSMETAMAELKAAKEARDLAQADLAALQAEYGDLGRQAQAAGRQADKTTILEQQHKVQGQQTPSIIALKNAEARVEAAKRAVGRAAEAEA